MNGQLFEGKEQIFRDVIQLGEKWKVAVDRSSSDGGSPEDIRAFQLTEEGKKIRELNEELESYLENLEFDDIRMIQTVMYLGRDRDYPKTESPEEIYENYLQDLSSDGWNSKEVEIRQMTSKVPFSSYLENGLEILQVKL
ncbi:DUF3775 domain-containing protein [Guptibacillus spartinae]|uniref:DUF3775 domain-containing protein n=1 Tax=Guptibacillus spartinae TaxID=3025679 RepID=UPI0023600714|nr:DUF3775 domain-containing protein [Pseudalkalibacillus spartinae]